MTDTPPAPPAADKSNTFLQAAWTHAADFLSQYGKVATVMILGRYADEQLTFVFPSRQDRADFARACEQEAQSFGADIAMLSEEAKIGDGEREADIIAVFWRERDGPIRAQYALLSVENGSTPTLGPIHSMLGEQTNEFLEAVFGPTKH